MHAGWWLPLGLFVLGAGFAGCAAGDDPPPDDDTSSSAGGSTSTQQGPSSTSAGGAGTGGAGQGGSVFPCGEDCALIQSPQCFEAVCNMGEYPGPIGACVVVPETDGTTCDDGQFCTVDDTCQAGTCTGGPQNTCGLTAAECEEVTCDEDTKSCLTAAVPDGGACTPADLCQENGTCTGGTCIGMAKDCFFSPVPNECFESTCNPSNGMCEPVAANDGQTCVDENDLCSVDNTCNNGVCSGGVPEDCSQLTMGCDLGVCDAATGICGTMAVLDGQACDDLDGCTTGEICTAGTCGGGTPVTACSGAATADGCCPTTCTAANDLDCACSSSTLTSPFNTNNGLDGNMFDIVAKKNVTIDGFDVNIGPGSQTIEIYYRAGTYVGFENSSAGWTQVGAAVTVTSNGNDVATPVPLTVDVTIAQGQTYGFYVTTVNGNINYSDGTSVGGVHVEDSAIQVLEGAGKDYPFTGGFSPRIWSGNVYYTECGN